MSPAIVTADNWSMKMLISRLALVGRVYAIMGQVYFGVGTCFAFYFLLMPLWGRAGVADGFGSAIFALFLWPMVVIGTAAN